MLTATGKGSVIYPVVIVEAEGIKCRALLDTGSGSSYASEALLQRLKKQPVRREQKRIEMMMQTTTQTIEVYDLAIKSLEGGFQENIPTWMVSRWMTLMKKKTFQYI